MSESRPEQYPDRLPLQNFHNELKRPGRTYGDMIIALDSYVQSELHLSDKGAHEIIYHMREDGVLPVADLFEYDRQLAVEQFRLTLWRYIVPLAEGIMDDGELDIWLPRAMEVILPKDSRHLPERCRLTPGVNATGCVIGNCPVMVIEHSLQSSMMTPDFSALEYTINPVKAMRNHHRRLLVATRHNIIPPEFANALEIHYQALCDEAFQGDS